MRLFRQYLEHNDCFKSGKPLRPVGVMVHSTGANNPLVSRYVPGDEIIGRNTAGNHWDQSNEEWKEKFGVSLNKCVHAFVGKLADGEVGAVQTLPWEMRGWHAGKSAGNNGYIGFEICEDGLEDAEYFEKVYREAVELTAMLCGRFELDPRENGVVICHAEGYRLGVASNHGDVLHWFSRFEKTMDDFRADVARVMERGEEMTQERFDSMLENWLTRQGEKAASDWAKDLLACAVESGFTDGTRPQSFATRQEVALMIRAAATK